MKDTIIVAAGGPSAGMLGAHYRADELFNINHRVFRTNYFFLPAADPLEYTVTDWFVCEDVADCRAVVAAERFAPEGIHGHVTVWIPGLNDDRCEEIRSKHLAEFDVRIQKHFPMLPAACRWEKDKAPERPLMGSYAIAVAVGMQPDNLILAGHDLFQHPSGQNHGGMAHDTRAWQNLFVGEYVNNTHRNHRLSGDIRYIRAALEAYEGELTCIGTVMKTIFEKDFPQWQWLNG